MAIKRRVSYNLSGSSGELPELADAEQASWNIFPLARGGSGGGKSLSSKRRSSSSQCHGHLELGPVEEALRRRPGLIGKTILLDADLSL